MESLLDKTTKNTQQAVGTPDCERIEYSIDFEGNGKRKHFQNY